jgi:hypothetical protein
MLDLLCHVFQQCFCRGPQALSNTVWALSKLAAPGERDEALLDAVAGAMLPALPDFNAQNIANTV